MKQRGCSYSAAPPGGSGGGGVVVVGGHSLAHVPPSHFSRWTMTALRRLACCSVLLSSVSSLLGKVVMRMNSRAAMAGRAATTNCRRSDTLGDATTRQGRKHQCLSTLDAATTVSTSQTSSSTAADDSPVGVVELLHQPAAVSQSDLDVGDGLGGVEVHRGAGLGLVGGLVLLGGGRS